MAVQESRELDVVVHGATGFAGRLVAAHLVRHAPDGVRVGLSGRSPDRLREVRDGLGDRAAAWPLLVADAQDDAALRDVARRTRVIASTVGPYERFGLPLTRACAGEGTDYVDLTGEVLFMRASIDANHATAQRTGARLVHACGFDSVPSDLGVLLLARAAATHGLGELGRTRFVLTGASGGFSGGTVDSLRAQVDRMRSDRQARRLVADPYSLSPDRGREPDRTVDGPGDGPDSWGVTWDEDAGRWLAPFVMGPVNSRVVRRSNALSDYSYGRGFTYRESVGLPGRVLGAPLAAGLAVGTRALGLGMALPPTCRLLDKVLPAVGTGPRCAAGGRAGGRDGGAGARHGAAPDAPAAGQGAPGGGDGAGREGPRGGVLLGPAALPHQHRTPRAGDGVLPGRPRLRRHGPDARRERARPGARP
ncbi:saccharopine dehydrogenase family protein [Aquipuribacter sp. MA13-6]|uniref:saccharopine dehydrogenase family protein n=1 Tax=Aquipuribacter sp. MA13-6 TaxID=3440839 RepID=UPI003EF00C0F